MIRRKRSRSWTLFATGLIFTASLLTAGCSDSKNSRFKEFTQCMLPIEQQHPPEANYHRDLDRACLGYRWRIPKSIYSRKYIAYGPIAEEFIIGLGSDRSALAAKNLPANLPTGNVHVGPLFNSPRRAIAEKVYGYARAMHLVDQSERQFGMNVKDIIAADGSRDALFYPDSLAYFALCRPFWIIDGKRQIERTTCDIHTVLDGKVYIQYGLPYSNLERLETTNNSLLNFLRQHIG